MKTYYWVLMSSLGEGVKRHNINEHRYLESGRKLRADLFIKNGGDLHKNLLALMHYDSLTVDISCSFLID